MITVLSSSRVDTASSKVRIENGELVVSPLEADERPESVVALEERIDRMLKAQALPRF